MHCPKGIVKVFLWRKPMLFIPLNSKAQTPMYEQIYQYLKEEIKTGRLEVHTRLPSTRNLAAHLSISRNTVELAYAQLVSEGYLESRPRSGYFVSPIGGLLHMKEGAWSEKAQAKPILVKQKPEFDFSPFSVDITGFPFSTWRKLSNQCMNNMNQDLFLLGDSQGDLPLRQAIAGYLHEARGVNCNPGRIVIGAGADYLLQLLRQLFGAECVIAMENPAYLRAYQILRGSGCKMMPVSVDKEGLRVDLLSATEAEVVYVTPSHQYPLGAVMPIKRRRELLAWAQEKPGRYIIEDDHDSEFRYKGKPIPSLQGIDTSGCVIYLGTFSRAIAPAIRVGYMLLPEPLYQIYQKEYFYYASTVSRIDQAILYEFIQGGYFERHVNKMRKRYRVKHDSMLCALKQFGNKVRISGENAGLYLVAEFFTDKMEQEVILRAENEGIRLYGLGKHYIGAGEQNRKEQEQAVILLGFGNLTEAQIAEGIKRLYHCIAKE